MILLFDWHKADVLGLFFFLFREAIMFHSSYVGELCLERSLEIAFASFSFLFVKACCLDFGFWVFFFGGGVMWGFLDYFYVLNQSVEAIS